MSDGKNMFIYFANAQARLEDSGKYMCWVNNTAGEETIQVTLTVTGKSDESTFQITMQNGVRPNSVLTYVYLRWFSNICRNLWFP